MANSSVVYDVKGLIRDLNAFEPGLKKEMVREAKDIAKPIASNIKQAIPTTAPLSGMSITKNPSGRLAWGGSTNAKGGRIPANQVSVRFRSGRSRTRAITPLLSIWVTSPMTAIADVAGKGSMRKAKKITNEYAYKNGRRTHRVTNQGRIMIDRLRQRNANDFIYPAVGDSIDDAEVRVKLVLNKYAKKVNRKLG
jgi:hypothetical protein